MRRRPSRLPLRRRLLVHPPNERWHGEEENVEPIYVENVPDRQNGAVGARCGAVELCAEEVDAGVIYRAGAQGFVVALAEGLNFGGIIWPRNPQFLRQLGDCERAVLQVVRLHLVVVHGLEEAEDQREYRRHELHERHQPVRGVVDLTDIDGLPHSEAHKVERDDRLGEKRDGCFLLKPRCGVEAGGLHEPHGLGELVRGARVGRHNRKACAIDGCGLAGPLKERSVSPVSPRCFGGSEHKCFNLKGMPGGWHYLIRVSSAATRRSQKDGQHAPMTHDDDAVVRLLARLHGGLNAEWRQQQIVSGQTDDGSGDRDGHQPAERIQHARPPAAAAGGA